VAATARLLGAEGLTLLLAAALTECRILIHSVNVADVAMVAEVITSLLFPFTWQLVYIPVLPIGGGMLEILDAPLPFFVGLPTASLKYVDKSILSEVVVVDLDDVSSFTEYDARRGPRTKIPPALPASVSTSISKAVFRLLKEDDELEQQMRTRFFVGLRRSSRLEIETLPERMFRIHVALQICSLVRGYQECLFFVSALQPVFNRDRFLRQAPALFEDKRPTVLIDKNFSDRSQKILSPRSKRFLSVLVNSQHFHQLLERLSSEDTAFFHEVMEVIEGGDDGGRSASKKDLTTSFGSSACEDAAQTLFESLERIEQRIPTYPVDRPSMKPRKRSTPGNEHFWTWEDDSDDEWKFEPFVRTNEPFWLLPEEEDTPVTFTHNILKPIMVGNDKDDPASSSGQAGVHVLSMEYLAELEKNPWRYSIMLDMPDCNVSAVEGGDEDNNDESKSSEENDKKSKNNSVLQIFPGVKLRDALGEKRYRELKPNDQGDDDEADPMTPKVVEQSENDGFDLSSILLNVPELPLDGGSNKQSEGSSAYETTQPRVEDAKDREKVRHCLELAFGQDSSSISFKENGRDLVADAELALRNPSAQRYLFSVLISSVQRRKARSQQQQEAGDSSKKIKDSQMRAMATQQSVSRLEPSAFECIVRMCYAVLEACTEEQNYESAYRLLTFTGGFCTTVASSSSTAYNNNISNNPQSTQSDQKTIYMTERISIHPIFADLRLWERVLLLHQQDQQNNERKDDANSSDNNEDVDEDEEKSTSSQDEDTTDNDAYDSSVTTLYEMVGYNVPAEEVSRFATRISEEKGWFATEKGQALLVLARRLTAKRDDGGDAEKTGGAGAGDFAYTRKDSVRNKDYVGGGAIDADADLEAEEIAWSMPSRCLVSYEKQVGARAFLGNMLGSGAADPMAALNNSTHGMMQAAHRNISNSKKRVLDANGGLYAGRVAITAMASFGGSAVVTGGIDGSIFLAHTINFGADKTESDFNCNSTSSSSPLHSDSRLVNGIQLQWGAKGDVDRESSAGSVTCIAASKGSGYRFGGGGTDRTNSKATVDQGCPDEEEIISSMDGCQVIAGTTGGGLRVWSLKDIYYASYLAQRDLSNASSPSLNRSHHGSGASSVRLGGADDFAMQDAIAGAPVGGHRGGITCIDLPPRMYRPDSLVSGGEDGLIKLWSLKSTSSSEEDGGVAQTKSSIQSRFFQGRSVTSITDFDASDAQGVLTGHEGKIICIKTAWHGDKLLSGGADKTVRLWDLSGSGGKPLTTLRGHQGLVTQTHFWGPNTIVSASTDRSIHLWDTRVGSSPLFALRYHLSPVSDLLLGNRSEPLMVSAGADCSLATWDFRVLSGTRTESSAEENAESNKTQSLKTMRSPMAKMSHIGLSKSSVNHGSVKLARSIGRDDFSFFSVSDDGIVNEWEAASGLKISTHNSGHRDAVSGFSTFSSKDGLRQNKSGGRGVVGGTITCSWDGTVRLRRLSRKPAH